MCKRFILLLLIISYSIGYGGELTPDYSFLGVQSSGRIGYYLAAAGDVNGDGYDDFMIGSYHNEYHGWNSGAVYLFLGRRDISWSLNSLVSEADAVFRGKHTYDLVGYNIAGEGDFNGDGFDDLLIGAPGNWERNPANPGVVYIVFGKAQPNWGDDFVLEDSSDLVIVGENDLDQFGYAVAFVGDFNNDGCDDIICGAPFRNQNDEWAGKVYLIQGKRNIENRRVNVATEARASFVYADYHAKLGSGLDGVGDVNQDGLPDFVLGAPGSGTSFLLLGRANLDWGANFDLNDADCIFTPEQNRDDGGYQVKGVGDVNGDNFDDFIISGLEIKFNAGKTYLILGRKDWPSAGIYLGNADASYIGEGTNQHSGVSVEGIEDFNGDGLNDFIIGARWYTGNSGPNYHRGKAYIIYGKKAGWERDVSLKTVDSYFLGEDSVNCAGWGVSSAGDVNGDYRNDIIISAPFSSEYSHWAGEVYLFLGDYPLKLIAGKTLYYATNAAVPSVDLILSGDVNSRITTDITGEYLFHLTSGDNFTVTPFKMANTDLSYKSITTYDAALTALHSVALDTLSPQAQIAADVNEDGSITIYDAALIANYAVNLPPAEDAHVGEWKFDPENRSYHSTSLPAYEQNFACILLGEVSGNWQLDNNLEYYKNSTSLLKISAVDTFLIPFKIKKDRKMISAEVYVKYNPQDIKLISIEKTDLTKDFHLFYNDQQAGELLIGMFGLPPVNEEGDILNVRFVAQRNTTVEVEKFQINNYQPQNARVNVELEENSFPEEFGLSQNYPNPFNPETVIKYRLAAPAFITLTVFNTLGQKIKTLDIGYKTAGIHKVTWGGKNDAGFEASNGLYFYELRCNGFSVTKKMLKLK